MNDFPVYISDEATLELQRISDYLKNILSSDQANQHFLDELERQKKIISCLPKIYGISKIPEVEALEGRVAPINKYLMIYVFDGEKVVILHFFHSLQDYGRLI